jgi:hypothetical protein
VASRVAQHVHMDWKSEASDHAKPFHELLHGIDG